jgi:hypothetical protein
MAVKAKARVSANAKTKTSRGREQGRGGREGLARRGREVDCANCAATAMF